MAYGLAEGLRKSGFKLRPKGKSEAVITGTFGNIFTMNEALGKIRQEGFRFETQKGHIVIIHLDKNTTEKAEKVRKIIRDHYGYVEPL